MPIQQTEVLQVQFGRRESSVFGVEQPLGADPAPMTRPQKTTEIIAQNRKVTSGKDEATC